MKVHVQQRRFKNPWITLPPNHVAHSHSTIKNHRTVKHRAAQTIVPLQPRTTACRTDKGVGSRLRRRPPRHQTITARRRFSPSPTPTPLPPRSPSSTPRRPHRSRVQKPSCQPTNHHAWVRSLSLTPNQVSSLQAIPATEIDERRRRKTRAMVACGFAPATTSVRVQGVNVVNGVGCKLVLC